jgi:hypothetical protein
MLNRAGKEPVSSFDEVWARIKQFEGQKFATITGLPFTYEVPGNYLLVSRTVRNLSRTNFSNAYKLMPVTTPSDLAGLQGASYTYAILMDRVRGDSF